MKAVVVYESMYGNTHQVALQVAAGLRADGAQVDVLPVASTTPDVVRDSDLLVVGGPTHVHGMARPKTRAAAVEQAGPRRLGLDPDAREPGLREWFDALPPFPGRRAAAFDTRADVPGFVSGHASHGIAHRLVEHGFTVLDKQSFVVDKVPVLLPGEERRAFEWGAALAALSRRETAAAPR
jgi:flavodoxin-like protein